MATLLRVLLVACVVTVVLVVVAEGSVQAFGYGPIVVLLPFVAIGALAVGMAVLLPRIDALVERLTHHREVTPYSALASAATRIRAGSLDQALPGLAQVLADGTGASRAVIWLAVGDRLVVAADYPTATPWRAALRGAEPGGAAHPPGHRPRRPGAGRDRAAGGAGHRQAGSRDHPGRPAAGPGRRARRRAAAARGRAERRAGRPGAPGRRPGLRAAGIPAAAGQGPRGGAPPAGHGDRARHDRPAGRAAGRAERGPRRPATSRPAGPRLRSRRWPGPGSGSTSCWTASG